MHGCLTSYCSYISIIFRYHPQFCRSRFLSKYQLEYISGGHLVMADILLNNNALFYFMEVSYDIVCTVVITHIIDH